MHNAGYKSALARRVCRYSDARPPRKTDGVLLESESPPHMRGKGVLDDFDGVAVRITPAYAGKRADSPPEFWTSWDHPRVCGEKFHAYECHMLTSGSPPHMRGKVKRQQATAPPGQDHPRICREKKCPKAWCIGQQGSPPRMRGKVCVDVVVLRLVGITPAYAGKSAAPA